MLFILIYIILNSKFSFIYTYLVIKIIMGLTYNGTDKNISALVVRINWLESYVDNVNERVGKLEETKVVIDLTKREQQVLDGVRDRTSTTDIAKELGVIPSDVSNIKKQLRTKGMIV